MIGSIGGAVFNCQGIFRIEKQGLAMRLGEGGGAVAPFFMRQSKIESIP